MSTTTHSRNACIGLPRYNIVITRRVEDGSEGQQTYWTRVIEVWDIIRCQKIEAGESVGDNWVEIVGCAHNRRDETSEFDEQARNTRDQIGESAINKLRVASHDYLRRFVYKSHVANCSRQGPLEPEISPMAGIPSTRQGQTIHHRPPVTKAIPGYYCSDHGPPLNIKCHQHNASRPLLPRALLTHIPYHVPTHCRKSQEYRNYIMHLHCQQAELSSNCLMRDMHDATRLNLFEKQNKREAGPGHQREGEATLPKIRKIQRNEDDMNWAPATYRTFPFSHHPVHCIYPSIQ